MSDLSDPSDFASRHSEKVLEAALSVLAENAAKKELPPSTLCYGCFADLSVEDQQAGALYCPDSSEECRDYHKVEQRQGLRRHMPVSRIYREFNGLPLEDE